MKNIKTSDLRLGNWLYYTNETKFLMQVVAIGDDWVQLDFEGNDGDSFEINGNEICPIPITKEFVKHIAGLTFVADKSSKGKLTSTILFFIMKRYPIIDCINILIRVI